MRFSRGSAFLPAMEPSPRGKISLPEYQRPYKWTVAQFDRLLKDLDHFVAQRHALAPNANAFYFGSIVLHQDAGALNITDGPQRLTSMAILG
jgi:uncharacterized protein with ParB-like and HNH nuclease domain